MARTVETFKMQLRNAGKQVKLGTYWKTPEVGTEIDQCQEVIDNLQARRTLMAPTTYGRLNITKLYSS